MLLDDFVRYRSLLPFFLFPVAFYLRDIFGARTAAGTDLNLRR